jgi:hypothetical protein
LALQTSSSHEYVPIEKFTSKLYRKIWGRQDIILKKKRFAIIKTFIISFNIKIKQNGLSQDVNNIVFLLSFGCNSSDKLRSIYLFKMEVSIEYHGNVGAVPKRWKKTYFRVWDAA